MLVVLMTDRPDDEIAFSCAGNRDFIAILVLFVVFAFGDTVHLRFMQGVNLVFVFGLLCQYPLIKQEVCLMTVEQTITSVTYLSLAISNSPWTPATLYPLPEIVKKIKAIGFSGGTAFGYTKKSQYQTGGKWPLRCAYCAQ